MKLPSLETREQLERLLIRVSLERLADIATFSPRSIWNELFAIRVVAHNMRYENLIGRDALEQLFDIANTAEHICNE